MDEKGPSEFLSLTGTAITVSDNAELSLKGVRVSGKIDPKLRETVLKNSRVGRMCPKRPRIYLGSFSAGVKVLGNEQLKKMQTAVRDAYQKLRQYERYACGGVFACCTDNDAGGRVSGHIEMIVAPRAR